ncbi:hypothetical protein YC2023_042081 [Brassica napus]|uniref:Uncharacterized protein n=1 Tax=Brassica oleracea TaxID=3712 RepID=A0A3P6BBA2_BRAOL|nr:unnamed protein product [Brassica oleracea]
MYAFWGSYAKQVYDYSTSNMSTIIICVIRFSSIKEWKVSLMILLLLQTMAFVLLFIENCNS